MNLLSRLGKQDHESLDKIVNELSPEALCRMMNQLSPEELFKMMNASSPHAIEIVFYLHLTGSQLDELFDKLTSDQLFKMFDEAVNIMEREIVEKEGFTHGKPGSKKLRREAELEVLKTKGWIAGKPEATGQIFRRLYYRLPSERQLISFYKLPVEKKREILDKLTPRELNRLFDRLTAERQQEIFEKTIRAMEEKIMKEEGLRFGKLGSQALLFEAEMRVLGNKGRLWEPE